MDIKDWILIVGGLLLAAVIGHGFYLAWRNRRDTLHMAIEHDHIPKDEVDELDLLRAELPNGGGRVRNDAPPEQGRLDLGEQAPVLMETDEAPPAKRPANRTIEPIVAERTVPGDRKPARPPEHERAARERVETRARREPEPSRREPEPKRADAAAPQELIVINVLAREGKAFEGHALTDVLLANDVKFGDMNIFHRFDPAARTTLYSIANAVEPGTFDLSSMDAFSTRGVSLFLKLPGPEQPLVAFDDMLGVARDLAGKLGGDLKDEQLSVMTPQTIEHCRARISEFSRKRMSQRA